MSASSLLAGTGRRSRRLRHRQQGQAPRRPVRSLVLGLLPAAMALVDPLGPRHRPGMRGPCRRLAHRAVDPGLPHVQALHRVQAGTPQRVTPVIPDGPLPMDVAPGSGCRWRCLQGPSCWPSGGSDPRWPPARRGYGGTRRSGSPPAGLWELGQAPVPA